MTHCPECGCEIQNEQGEEFPCECQKEMEAAQAAAFAEFKAGKLKRECTEENPCEADGCQSCCPHDFDADEGYTCLHCGKEGFEDMACAAYDYWKDSRYDE